MVQSIKEIYLEEAFINAKENEANKLKVEELKKLEKEKVELEKKLKADYVEFKNKFDKDDYIELDWNGAKLLYIKNQKCILPQLDKFPDIKVSTTINGEEINRLTNKVLGIKVKSDFWSIVKLRTLKRLNAKNSNLPYQSNDRLLFSSKAVSKVVVSTSKSSSLDIYNFVTKRIEINSNGIGTLLPCIYLDSAENEFNFFKKHNMKILFKEVDIKLLEELKLKKAKLQREGIKATYSKEEIYSHLLSRDKVRADIEEYNSNLLTDPNKGIWDSFINESDNKGQKKVALKGAIYIRNPKLDIRQGGIIAIDFGTKSTVVIQEDNSNHIYPLRIGNGNYSKTIKSNDYENPTVMEFIDINKFMKDYKKIQGRPNTNWSDLTISHTAQQRVFESSSKDYSSIFSSLKQWCGDSERKIRIKDKNSFEFELNNFLKLDEKSINPIELYAYYIGLNINNMRNGIYLEYFLSFPVTYSLEVIEKIRLSFERGLKKSLPISILNDKEVMDKFRVVQGSSEPAAYAVTALLEYGFEPEDDEKVFYGIFDFGGGTTDFDFGIWREADYNNRDEERYDYVIEHFGASGDQYLGGENLLELLAFEVFKENRDKLLASKIQFIKPSQCKVFPGSESLLSDSQEAILNTKKLMEELREIWEGHKGYKEKFNSGMVSLNLYNANSKQLSNFELDIDLERVLEILEKRIEDGVIAFFESLKNTFHQGDNPDVDKINIFLAGNSSKSTIVKKLFKKHSDNIAKDMGIKDAFEIFNPLGEDSKDYHKPNGKTGVAYGIIKTKAGGKIKVVNRNTSNNSEDRFKFYIGKVRKERLEPIITPDCDSEWVRYYSASERDFEVFYTSNPRATTRKMSIADSKKLRLSLKETNSEADIYIKKSGLNMINIVVAKEAELKQEKYIEDLGEFRLR